MTTKTIERNSWLYRLAYLDRKEKPTQVNLCDTVLIAGFHLMIVAMMGVIGLFVMAAPIVILYVVVFYALPMLVGAIMSMHVSDVQAATAHIDWQQLLLIVGSCVVLIASAILPRVNRVEEAGQHLAAFIRAKKQKICPIYTVV